MSVLQCIAWFWPFPLRVASELILWPSEDVMRLVLVSPAVTLPLAFLGEEVLGLGTRKYSQVFHRCCPTTHSFCAGRKSGNYSLQRPWAGQLPVHFPPQAFMLKVGLSAMGKAGQGRAGLCSTFKPALQGCGSYFHRSWPMSDFEL